MSHRIDALAIVLLALTRGFASADGPDIVFEDFEGADYGKWATVGTAFGAGPAKGTLPNQMAVSGFLGKSLVNSFLGGDAGTGTLTSPEFKVERRYVHFLIGGGGHVGKTCMNLVVDGEVVRTATGPNLNAGGSEELEPAGWDVADLAGQSAKLVIVDEATGGWGHINVDHIVFSDRKPAALALKERQFVLDKKFLHFPVSRPGNGKARRVALVVDGATVREFEIELAGEPDWYAHLDVSAWAGRKAIVRVDKLEANSKALDLVEQADIIKGQDTLYREPLRPQLHFSSKRGWLNDPNGMVFANGEYHLYYQHNPYGWNWGNMHWGHAVSKDLIRWEELPIALYPRKFGDWAFSGSAVVDRTNTSGWKKGDNDLMVLAYTSTGRGECIAYSNDRGRSWTEHDGNPVVKHEGRDPRLLWHEPTRQWIMAVYDESAGKRWIAFHSSPDLKKWTYQSRIEGFYECPDFFELPVIGAGKERKWVLSGADSDYMVGTFDGKSFAPETPKLKGSQGRGFYAAQTFIDDPKSRVIQIGWLQSSTPKMPFNQAMSVPLELKLLATDNGPRLAWSPAQELASLRTKSHHFGPLTVKPGDRPVQGVASELIEVRADFATDNAAVVTFTVRGVAVTFDNKKRELNVGGHRVANLFGKGKQRLTILADRTSLEVFASDGLCFVPFPIVLNAKDLAVTVAVTVGEVRFDSIDVEELRSIWSK